MFTHWPALAILALSVPCFLPGSALADASGAPGLPYLWPPALKQAVGTAYESEGAASPLWFTVAQGIVTEVFYPSPDEPQVGDLQFLVSDGRSAFVEQKRDTDPQVNFDDGGMTVVIRGRDRGNRFTYEERLCSDGASPVLRAHFQFTWLQPGLRLFILFKPTVGATATGNLASATPDGLFATRVAGQNGEAFPTLALASSTAWGAQSAGYVGFSDGWQDLSKNFQITEPATEAGPGNVALAGEVVLPDTNRFALDLALGFGATSDEALTYARGALSVPFERTSSEYDAGWNSYLNGLGNATSGLFALRSAVVIKMHEDKRRRGAIVASLSKPAIPNAALAPDRERVGAPGGYDLVWPRDLYHAAMGLLAAGDRRTPIDVLHDYALTQRPDGSWVQNFQVDGTPFWTGIQMDESSFPILLAAKLNDLGVHVPTATDLAMVRGAASFLLTHGPRTDQDRWEEIGGYVPSTLAAEIAALRAATALLGDPVPAQVADRWQAQLETWTYVQTPPPGETRPFGGGFYLRASPGGNPDSPESIRIANDGGNALAWDLLDSGFLELVRLGVRGANDPRVLSTLQIYESPSAGIAQNGYYRRYNRDAYGPQHVGGYWPLLSGERGHLAVAQGDLETARRELADLEASALESGLIPEQVIAPSRTTTVDEGVACPLVWAHAEDILLHRSIQEGRVFDAPAR